MELIGFFKGEFSPRDPYRHVKAVPGEGDMPAIWLLGSSGYSAQLAGLMGLPFSFAHHFMPQNTIPALEIYRRSFRPSADLEAPYAMIGVAVVTAETDERARWLQSPGGLSFLRLRTGRPGPFPSPEEAAAYEYAPHEHEFVERWGSTHVVGGPDTVRAGLEELQRQTGADELMVTTMVHDHADRLRSYELLAQALGEGAAQSRAA
jgi:luciferase family oxidoreductase group 1